MTSQVLLTGPTRKSMVVRALLDPGAEVSILSSGVMKNLQLKRTDEWTTLKGIESPENSPARPTAMVTVSSLSNKNWSKSLKVTVLPKLDTYLPKEDLQFVKEMPHVKDLCLADPYFYQPRKVDILLDVALVDEVMLAEKIEGPPGTPTAWKTELGWGIRRRYVSNGVFHSPAVAMHITGQEAVDFRTDQILEKFWKMEELPKGSLNLSVQEEAVQQHYAATHYFSPPARRYVVTLPKRQTTLQLGESRKAVLDRFIKTEQSLLWKGNWAQFQSVVQEYLTLGHAQLVTSQELCTPTQQVYYLPMHGVFKSSSTSTKLRVVFDASSKTSTGISLNDILEAGPTLHPNLDQILIRFRSYKVALSADIGKMYREVSLSQPNRQLHRFLWREQPDQPIKDYCMNRVTFGVTSSPYAAVRTLQQTAKDFSQPGSIASWHVCESFYVDDLLAGAETEAEALELYKELRGLLQKGGFELKKWRSSSTEVLHDIPSELQELLPQQDLVDNHTAAYPKTLGISWDSRQDVMAVQVQLPETYASTKRGIVSDMARSFDVLGWLAPFILNMKILFQKLWKKKVGWDQTPGEEFVSQHREWRELLPLLKTVTVPRCYFDANAGKTTSIQLHGFCDASEHAFAAVVYLRATYEEGSVSSRLVVAKIRVTPLKTVSIPRLELCGAEMLAELLANIGSTLKIQESSPWLV